MSSNKTIIPGMEDAYLGQPSNFNTKIQEETYIPNPFPTYPSGNEPNRKPIVGFLYSISKSASGEFWPLRIGSNSIGRSSDCDISLGEATVSEQHAILVVRQMKNPEKIIASICDARSTCGTMINGESLGFDQRECVNGDIITVGEHYDLLFILIDAKQIGLSVCREFMPIQGIPNYATQMPNASPYSTVFNNGMPSYQHEDVNSQGGTVGFNESTENKQPATNQEGTIFM